MTSVAENVDAKTQLGSDLAAGVVTLSLNQTVEFRLYSRYTQPLDGTVYWIRGESTIQAQGSLHYAIDTRQNEDENVAMNHVVFTSLHEVNDLNSTSPEQMYIGEFQGQNFSFSSRGSFYKQADLYHYRGDAVYPALEDVLVASVEDLNSRLVVSNSLPAWLTITTGGIPVYPSFLVPGNLRPPYIAVHIDPAQTAAIQAVPRKIPLFNTTQYVQDDYWSPNYTGADVILPLVIPETQHSQLAKDKVRITCYGLRNDEALAYLDNVLEYSANTDIIGLMNMPIVRDEKRFQTELGALALKKTLEFEVSYYQSRIYDVAVKLIRNATIHYFRG